MRWQRELSNKVVVVVAVLVVVARAHQPLSRLMHMYQLDNIYYAFYGGRNCFNIRVIKER